MQEPQLAATAVKSGRREAMTMPGFNAKTSLYKSSVCYHLMGSYVQAGGVVPQQFTLPFRCGPCIALPNGCVQTCSRVYCQPGWPFPSCKVETYNVPCPWWLCLS